MNINKDYLDIAVLEDGFTLSALWEFRELVGRAKIKLEDVILLAVKLGESEKAIEYSRQLHFVESNLDYIEFVMTQKENDIFMFTDYGDVCLN